VEQAVARDGRGTVEAMLDVDRALLGRVVAGDRAALGELYARHQRPLFAYLIGLCRDRGLAEEVLQDTMLAVWTSAGSFGGRSSVRAWLYGVARRQAHNTLRRRAPAVADGADLELLPSAEPEPEDVALAGARREELAGAIERLAPVHREVLLLSFGEGLSYPELTQVLGVPLGTVKSRLSNAKRALRALLEASEARP
jgi:RNA polymerase sigma factor (sigma-70 family)